MSKDKSLQMVEDYITGICKRMDMSIRRNGFDKDDRLLDMLKAEVAKTGLGVWSDRRKAIEEMLRMRGVTPRV